MSEQNSSRRRNSNVMSRASDLLGKFDNFGETAGFHIEGEATKHSVCGSLVSIAILVLTMSYAYRRFNVLREYGDSTHIRVDEADANNDMILT